MTVPNGSGRARPTRLPEGGVRHPQLPRAVAVAGPSAVFTGGGNVTSAVALYPTGSGDSYSWGSTGIVVDHGNSPVSVRLCRQRHLLPVQRRRLVTSRHPYPPPERLLMTVTHDQAAWFAQTFSAMVANCDKAVLGKEHVIRLALTCMLSEGHLLLEDFPGTGKTQLARAISSTVQGTNSRIQFTPDLLPSDVTGVTIYDPGTKVFEFHRGPDLRDDRARRRDQPRLAQDAVGAARGHGGEQGHRRRRAPRGGRAVHGHRDPEPHRAGRHLPPARGPARPLPHEDDPRLPRPRRDGPGAARRQDPRPHQGPPARGHLVRRHRHGRARRRGARRRRDPRLRLAHRRGDPAPRQHPARAVGARLPRLRPLRQDLGDQPGPRPRRARRHQAARAAGAQPPPARHRRGRSSPASASSRSSARSSPR